jgi:hypothetical protein
MADATAGLAFQRLNVREETLNLAAMSSIENSPLADMSMKRRSATESPSSGSSGDGGGARPLTSAFCSGSLMVGHLERFRSRPGEHCTIAARGQGPPAQEENRRRAGNGKSWLRPSVERCDPLFEQELFEARRRHRRGGTLALPTQLTK